METNAKKVRLDGVGVRIMKAILCVVMVLGLSPTVNLAQAGVGSSQAYAEETYVAAVTTASGTTYCADANAFMSAWGSISGEATVTLFGTVSLGFAGLSVGSEQSITLDLNGQTLTSSFTKAITLDGGALTLNDSVGTGLLKSSDMCGIGVYATTKGGTLVVNGGSVYGHYYGIDFYNAATCTINGGSISCVDKAAVRMQDNDAKATINGGYFKGSVQNSGTMTVSGGYFNGQVSNSGTMTVNGGYYTAAISGSYATPSGRQLLEADTTYKGVTYHWAMPVAQIGGAQYVTLEDAIAAVPTDGTETTITLASNISKEEFEGAAYEFASGKNVVLDLAGYTLFGTATKSDYNSLIAVDEGATLTIKDTSSGEAGGITYSSKKADSSVDYDAYLFDNQGTLSVLGGTFNVTTLRLRDSQSLGDAKPHAMISGGKWDIEAVEDLNAGSSDGAFAVSGGVFTAAAKAALGDALIEDGCSWLVNTDVSTNAIYPYAVGVAAASIATYAGTNNYASLADALDVVADGQTIRVESDIDVTSLVTIDKPDLRFVIDLNGFKIERTDGSVFDIYSTVTFKDSSAAGTGTIKADGAALCGNAGADFTLESGNLVSTSGSAVSVIGSYGTQEAPSKFTMSGGTITINAYLGKGVYVHSNEQGAQFTMSGGTISSSCYGVDLMSSSNEKPATFIMTGGSVSGNGGSAVCADGTSRGVAISISGGKIAGTTASAIDMYNSQSSLTISGGLFKSASGNDVITKSDSFAGTISISGGYFSTPATAEDWAAQIDPYLATDFAARANNGLTADKTEYPTMVAAKSAGDVVVQVRSGLKADDTTSVANVTGGGLYVVGQDVTFTASAVENAKFDGWFAYVDGMIMGDALSTSCSYTFTACADASYIAVYEPEGSEAIVSHAGDEVYSEGLLYYTVNDGSVTITGCFGENEVLIVPTSIAGCPVSTIAAGAFVGNSNLETVVLPQSSISEIQDGAFGEGINAVFATIELQDFGGNYDLVKYTLSGESTAEYFAYITTDGSVRTSQAMYYKDGDTSERSFYCVVQKGTTPALKQVSLATSGVAYDDVEKGDVNCNGRINIVDAQIALDISNVRYSGFDKLSPDQVVMADVNEDLAIDATDARAIQFLSMEGRS